MRTEAPPLMPIFRSALQARLLLRVLTSEKAITSAELARSLDVPEPTVSREVRRLVEAGLLRGERVGRAVQLSSDPENPATAPLRQLLIVTFGPSHLVEQKIRGISGIEAAFVHGSWAARFHGEAGAPPGDIDLIIVGTPHRGAVDAALDGLEDAVGREINVTHVSPERWNSDDDPFISAVRSRPLVELALSRRAEAS